MGTTEPGGLKGEGGFPKEDQVTPCWMEAGDPAVSAPVEMGSGECDLMAYRDVQLWGFPSRRTALLPKDLVSRI